MAENGAGASHRKIWYVVNDPASREYVGPYSVSDIVQMIEDGRLRMNESWAFKKDDTSMVPIQSVPGVERRQPRESIELELPVVTNKADKDSWWYATEAREVVGPLNIRELRKDLVIGKINRETPVWQQGMDAWIYLFQVDDFDRRESS